MCSQGDQSEICGGRDCTVCQCFPAKGARVSLTAQTQGMHQCIDPTSILVCSGHFTGIGYRQLIGHLADGSE